MSFIHLPYKIGSLYTVNGQKTTIQTEAAAYYTTFVMVRSNFTHNYTGLAVI
tara:strand:- start:1533 stop:1688 length:156 start_codon:yes stop_codon:yes gene_type:complete